MASDVGPVFSLYAILDSLHIVVDGKMMEVWPIKDDHSILQFKKYLPSITSSHLHALLWKLGILRIRAGGQIIVIQNEFEKLDNADKHYLPFHLNIRTDTRRIKGGYTAYSVAILTNDSNVSTNQHILDMQLTNHFIHEYNAEIKKKKKVKIKRKSQSSSYTINHQIEINTSPEKWTMIKKIPNYNKHVSITENMKYPNRYQKAKK